MNYLKKFDLEYTTPDLQYNDVDFTEADIIEAEYIRVPGFEDKPDIAALPVPLIGSNAVKDGIYVPPVLTSKDAKKHLKIYAMRDVRFPMFNQGEINKRIYEGLLSSYDGRSYAVTERPIKIKDDEEPDKQIEISVLSSIYMNGSSKSSGLIGLPGTGKSTALNIALQRYPRAIIHRLDGCSYVQIPIIRTTAYANSNLTALFYSFAEVLDTIFDCEHRHRDEIKKGNLGKATERVISWIKRYHIGCWIIEELEFFSFSTEHQTSFENIVTIMQETGVFLFSTGNLDLIQKLSGNLRQERRLLANYINMDLMSQDKDGMRTIVAEMWQYLLPEMQTEFTDELYDEIYYWTLGSIDMISILLVAMQQEYLEKKKNEQRVTVNVSFIKQVGKAKLTRMRQLFSDGQTAEVVKAYEEAQEQIDREYMLSKGYVEAAQTKAAIKEEIEAGYNHYQKYIMVKDAIEMVISEYTENQIRSAFNWCEAEIDEFKRMTNKQMVAAVMERLKNVKNKRKTEKKKKIQANLEEFQKEILGSVAGE